jgi:hypothetical protein
MLHGWTHALESRKTRGALGNECLFYVHYGPVTEGRVIPNVAQHTAFVKAAQEFKIPTQQHMSLKACGLIVI